MKNDVYDPKDMVDLRKRGHHNYITGRWVLTIKRDKEGNFLKIKARWVLRGFQDRQVWDLQTDSPTSTRPGYRLQCQIAANRQWDITHIDLKTAFLQGDHFTGGRDIVCQLPPEAGYPPHMAARLKRAAYGLNDAPRLWWNRLDKALRGYGLVPTRADRCCYVLYAPSKRGRSAAATELEEADDDESPLQKVDTVYFGQDKALESYETLVQRALAKRHDDDGRFQDALVPDETTIDDIVAMATDICAASKESMTLEEAMDLLMNPVTGSPARGKQVEGIVTIHVDDTFMTGSKYFVKKVVDGLKRDFKVGSEDFNNVLFVGQKTQWRNKGKTESRIEVDQEIKIEELEEIVFDKSLKDDQLCPPILHKAYRSLLGQINWLQSRTQFHACFLFSRCASACAKPTYGDVRAINKLCRTIRAIPVKLNFWTLKGKCRLLGYPDAAFKNNADGTSQRGHVIFVTEPRWKGVESPRGSLVDYESTKIKRTTLSTTVAELYSFMKCYGTLLFLKGLWMDLSGEIAEIHMRTDANNLVTTAKTTHLPEQKETIHMISQIRTEACSGDIDDLAHVPTADMLADPMTKSTIKADALIKAVNTSYLPGADKQPLFRDMMRGKHRAYLAAWITDTLESSYCTEVFLGLPVWEPIETYCAALSGWHGDEQHDEYEEWVSPDDEEYTEDEGFFIKYRRQKKKRKPKRSKIQAKAASRGKRHAFESRGARPRYSRHCVSSAVHSAS